MQADLQESEKESEKDNDKDMIDLFEREDRLMDVGNIQMEPCILVGVEDLSYHRLSGEEKVRSRQMETIGTWEYGTLEYGNGNICGHSVKQAVVCYSYYVIVNFVPNHPSTIHHPPSTPPPSHPSPTTLPNPSPPPLIVLP